MNPDSAVLDSDTLAVQPIKGLSDLISKDFAVVTELGQAWIEAGATMQAMAQAMARPTPAVVPAHRLPPSNLWSPQLVADLRGGARAIRRLGWIRGTWVVPGVGVCGMGGVMVSISGRDTGEITEPEQRYRVEDVARAMAHWLGTGLPGFNDHAAESGEQVIAELEACADAVERAIYGPQWRTPRYAEFARLDYDAPLSWMQPKVLEPA